MNRVKSVLEEIRVDKQVKEYDTLKDLLEAYVNDGITHGRYFNILVFGETLYIDKGNDGKHLYYYQQAIRLTDDVYVLNGKPTDDHHITSPQLCSIIAEHIRATPIMATLPTLNKKVEHGKIFPAELKETIAMADFKRVREALKRYGKDRLHERAIENFNYLITVYLDPNGQETLLKSEIKDMAKALRRARTYCKIVDRYLDVLRQLPERDP